MDIFNAVRNNDFGLLKSELNNQNINNQDKNGMSLLMHAIDNNSYDIAKYLIQSGINIDIQDKYGQTAVMLAAGRNLQNIVKLLIESKANLKLISKSKLTAYGFAEDNGNIEVAKIIKKYEGK